MLDRSLVLPHLLAQHAADVPDRIAMIDVEGRTATYRQLQDTYRTWADALRRIGVAPGHTVATMLPNSFVAYEAWLGAAWLGSVEVPIVNGPPGTRTSAGPVKRGAGSGSGAVSATGPFLS